MQIRLRPTRLLPLIAAALASMTSLAAAQADPEKPVTPPNSYRVVMENERMRMLEIHIKPHSKVEVDSPANRDRFLYMLSGGALILAPPGKTPYEFALHAGETAVFPAVSPTVENDTDSAVRALMVEIKQPMRTAAASKTGGKVKYVKGSRTKITIRSRGNTKQVSVARSGAKATKSARSVRAGKPVGSAANLANSPLSLSKAAAKPKKISGKGKGSSS